MTVSPEVLGEVASGLTTQSQVFTQAMLGSLHDQHRAASQQAATKAALAAVQNAEQAEIIKEQAAEIERLQALLDDLTGAGKKDGAAITGDGEAGR